METYYPFFEDNDPEDPQNFLNPCGEDVEIALYQDMLHEARLEHPDVFELQMDMESKLRQGIITEEQRQYVLAVLTQTRIIPTN